jgi:hypothetical protein
MIIQPIQVVQNDYGYQIPFTLEDGNGNAVNLTGATLSFQVQSAQDPSQALLTQTGVMAIDTPASGTCHYTPALGDFPNPGRFIAAITATWSGSEILTWSGIPIVVIPALPVLNN